MTVIIGAGISGLALAYFLQKKDKEYVLIEESPNAGGMIKSVRKDGRLFEYGPNSIQTDPVLLNLIEDIGLKDEMIEATGVSKERFIFRNNKYNKLPSGPIQLFSSGFLSWSSKIKIISEFFNNSKSPFGETISSFIERRFGKEVSDYILKPFISGIYAGNANELIAEKIFPQMVEYEKKYGSVIKGFMKNKTIERKKIISFKNGIQSFPETLAKKIKYFQSNLCVNKIERNLKGYSIDCNGKVFQTEKICFALPAYKTAKLLTKVFPDLAESLFQIDYAPLIVVHSVYTKKDVRGDVNGFGGLNPAKENCFSLGSIWTSSIFPDRCSENEVMFTTFVGGRTNAEKFNLNEHEILSSVNKELSMQFKIRSSPVFQQQIRIEKSIPQYNNKIIAVHELMKKYENENLYICSNFVNGVSVTDCIKNSKLTAEKL